MDLWRSAGCAVARLLTLPATSPSRHLTFRGSKFSVQFLRTGPPMVDMDAWSSLFGAHHGLQKNLCGQTSEDIINFRESRYYNLMG